MKAILTIGVSGSGKSTWVKNNLSPEEFININRDNIRAMFLQEIKVIKCLEDFSWDLWNFTEYEKYVSQIVDQSILLAKEYDVNIVISDTNLNRKYRGDLIVKLQDLGFDVEYAVFDVDYDTCVARDLLRKNPVGSRVIAKQWKQWLEFKATDSFNRVKYGEITRHVPYKIPEDKNAKQAIIVDLDGTAAHMVDRKPFDWDKVSSDEPDPMMQFIVGNWQRMNDVDGRVVIFLSGRDGVCEEDTRKWIIEHFPNTDFEYRNEQFPNNSFLYMRNAGDTRKDTVVKYEMFQEHIADRYNIVSVFDDRPSVVNMWNDLGLKVWATGDQRVYF
jgi:predicted kinase